VVIVGSGVVGTATGVGLAAAGHRVLFCDVSETRMRLLRKRGFATIGPDQLREAEPAAYLLSVPTPTVSGGTDTSFLQDASEAVGLAMRRHRGWPVVVVRSTVPPGTTENVVIPTLEATSGKRAGAGRGEGFGVCMNPEFLRAASAESDFMNPRVIVIGAHDGRSEQALRAVYEPWRDVPTVVTTLRTAEATKYVANLFNATKISFFNEMHRILSAAGADPDVAAGAATLGAEGLWNPRYGTRGGAPFDGACLPKDSAGFLGFADSIGMGELMPILRAVIRVNEELAAAEGGDVATTLSSGDEEEVIL
jgi:UDPglucose 6-dehydrogenase